MTGGTSREDGVTATSRGTGAWSSLNCKFHLPANRVAPDAGLRVDDMRVGDRVVLHSDGCYRGAIVHEFDEDGHPTLLVAPGKGRRVRDTVRRVFRTSQFTLDGFRVPDRWNAIRKHRK